MASTHPAGGGRRAAAGIPLPLLEDLVASLACAPPVSLDDGPILIGLPDPHDPAHGSLGHGSLGHGSLGHGSFGHGSFGHGSFDAVSMAGRDPLELRTLPVRASWAGLAVLTAGWALLDEDSTSIDPRSMAVDGPMPSRHPNGKRVVVAQAVERSGGAAMASAFADAGLEMRTAATPDAAHEGGPTGPMFEAMQRLLGLPTAPPPARPVELWATLWLADVQHALRTGRPPGPGARGRQRWTWRRLAALHPGLRLLEGDADVGADQLHVVGEILARHLDWTALRLRTATGEIDLGLVDPDTAGWADEGMFARLCLRGLPPIWALVRDIAGRANPRVLAGIQEALTTWDVAFAPPGAPPAEAVQPTAC